MPENTCKLLCAPMATLSHEAFRRIIEHFGGCDEYYTEMINAGSLLTRGPFEKYYLMNGPVPEKIVWQLTGNKTESLAAAAQIVSGLGGIGVDLNMGCSAPEIYKSGAGIAWMCKPQEETQIMVRSVKNILDKSAHEGHKTMRLSVKLRLGDENYTEDSFFSFVDMLAREGVERFVLHPRTKKEKYSRPPKWEYVERLALHFRGRGISVVLNGAVKDTASALAAMETAPHADGIMIARAAVQKPWIFAELQYLLKKTPEAIDTGRNPDMQVCRSIISSDTGTSIDLLQLGLDYLDALELYQPVEFWKTRAQRFFAYYCNNFSFAHYIQTQMLNAADIEDSRRCLAAYFDKVPEDRYLPAPFLFS